MGYRKTDIPNSTVRAGINGLVPKSKLDIQDIQDQLDLLTPANLLISGNVVYDTGLTFNVSALTYKIQGVTYNTAPTSVTLGAADVSFPRIDVIYADSTGTVGVLAGTPAADPVKPSVDTATQLELTFVTVAAGATTPVLTEENVYKENVEWTGTTDGTVIFNSVADPYEGTNSIETTSPLGSNKLIKFTRGSDYTVTSGNLTFYIKLKQVLTNNLRIAFYDSNVLQGNEVSMTPTSFGLDANNVSTYQVVSIPLSTFGSISLVDELRFTRQSGFGTVDFFMDNIVIQELPSEAENSTNAFSTTLNLWTLDAGTIYYADAVHDLGTEDVNVTLYDAVSKEEIQVEKIKRLDSDTVRIFVEGNLTSVRATIISGQPTFSGLSGRNVRSNPADGYTAQNNDIIIHDVSGGSKTVNLPPVGISNHFKIDIKKVDSSVNTITIDPNASELIEGGSTAVITTQYEAITIVCDGGDWWILAGL